jgi:hypothetical protein
MCHRVRPYHVCACVWEVEGAAEYVCEPVLQRHLLGLERHARQVGPVQQRVHRLRIAARRAGHVAQGRSRKKQV